MVSPRTFAFVFARGGSKGLPGKNLLPIAGIPLLAYGIRLAQQLSFVEAVFVSTDCPQIAETASLYGAKIITRPNELASDSAPEWLAWQHAVEYVESNYGDFDHFLSLPPTAPCRNSFDVSRCLDALSPAIDLVLTVTPSRRNPYFNMVTRSSNGHLKLVNNYNTLNRRQDSPQCFDITTVAYASRPSFILQASNMWEGKITGVEVPSERAIDIDDALDFSIAQFLIEQKNVHLLSSFSYE